MLRVIKIMPQETLAAYVSRIMSEKGLSGYDVERRSRKKISHSHVNRVQNGLVNPTADKLKALSKGLDVPEHELFAVARGLDPARPLTNERLAAIDLIYSDLPKPSRAAADLFIEMLERELRHLEGKSVASTNGMPVAPTGSKIPLAPSRERKQRKVR